MWIFALGFLFIFFLLISIFLYILKLIFKKKIFVTLNIAWWILFISLPILLTISSIFTTKKEVDKDDIIGNYVINRNICSGKQADWQYNHYRFKITEDDKIFFYITEKENIIKTIEGNITYTEYTNSPHIKIELDEPKFHILASNPTLYREIWSFYYVFESNKYGNMFFTKGNWKPID
jgi:Mn2+/Fe2+ NRAMP family transporter